MKLDLVSEFGPKSQTMRCFWASALLWAVRDPEAVKAFQADTGVTAPIAHSPLDAMIDAATGRDEHFARAFAEWFNRNVWGVDANGLAIDVRDVETQLER